METRLLIASIALVLISASAMAVVSVGPITFPSNPGTTYFEPSFEFGDGTTASHRIALTFNSGVGKITEFAMVPTFDNCLPLDSRSATDTANCSVQEYSKDSKCQVYAQKVTANAPRCVIKISYISGTETKSKFFEANNDQTIKIIDDPTGTITPTNCAAAITKINDKPLSQVPFYIDPTVALKVDFIVDPKCDFSKYSLDVWALDASSDITAVLKDKKANRLKQFLFASGDKTNIFTTKSISIAAPLNNAKYYKNPASDVLPENTLEITTRNTSLTFNGFTQANSGKKFYLVVENNAKKDSVVEPTDWKDSQTIEATFTKPETPVNGCKTVLDCLILLNQKIVNDILGLKKKNWIVNPKPSLTVGIADNSSDFSFATDFAQDLTVDVPASALNETPLQVNVIVQDLPENSVPSVVIEKDSPVAKLFSDEFKKSNPDLPVTEVPREELPKVDLGLLNAPQAPIVVLKVPKGGQNQPLRNAAANAIKKLSIVQAPITPAGIGGVKVFIDPGHGGITADGESGAVFNGVSEKNLALQVSQRVLQKLQAKGIQAASSRTGNEAITISDRVARANAFFESNPAASNYLVSIHFDQPTNSCPGESKSSPLYNCIDTPACSNVVQESKSFADAMASAINGKGIASKVQTMSEGQSGIGEKGEQLGIFNGLNTKNAVLLELEYLCNQENAQKVQSAEWKEKASDAIVEGIMNFSQASSGIDSTGFKTVFATTFGTSPNTVALPLNEIRGKKSVIVCSSKNPANCVTAIVGDTGPWCTTDPNYVNGTAQPFAKTFEGKLWTELTPAQQSYCGNPTEWPGKGYRSNGAGIDLSKDIAQRLGISGDPKVDQVKWKFT